MADRDNNLIITIGELIDRILHFKAYRKKIEAETRLIELKGLEKKQQIYRSLVADQKALIKDLEEKEIKLNEENSKLRQVRNDLLSQKSEIVEKKLR